VSYTLPAEVGGSGAIYDGNRVIVNTGAGDDQVLIGVDPVTGRQVVEINGIRYYFDSEAEIVVRGGTGDDAITVAPSGRAVTLVGGAGQDVLTGGPGGAILLGLGGNDRIYGGTGTDRASGGSGRDYIDGGQGDDVLSGGRGNDVVYGLSGDDAISGGEGADYLEGARNDDTIDGGAGNDVISGGRGDDTIRAGADTDVVYAGAGADVVDGGTDAVGVVAHAQGMLGEAPKGDTAYVDTFDDVEGIEQQAQVVVAEIPDLISVEGTPSFYERANADLDMLAASPSGQQMLAALEDSSETGSVVPIDLTISEYVNPDNPDQSVAFQRPATYIPVLPLVHEGVQYAPALIDITLDGGPETLEIPPTVLLYHELAHVYDHLNNDIEGTYTEDDNLGQGTGVPNSERVAVGLPIDHDGDLDTPNQLHPGHPAALTENALREEMGLPPRERY
jgi:hypothetical protein